MASIYSDHNKCTYCSRKSSDGVIRKFMFFCSDKCYDKQKRHDARIMGHHSPVHRYVLPPIWVKCDHCLKYHDHNRDHGASYGDSKEIWLCSDCHFKHVVPEHSVTLPDGRVITSDGRIITSVRHVVVHGPPIGHGSLIIGHPVIGFPGGFIRFP